MRFILQLIIGLAGVAASLEAATAQETQIPRRPLMLLELDSGNPPEQITPNSMFMCGSPDFSADGSKIIFDTWNEGEEFASARVAMLPFDGQSASLDEITELCKGAMPSWAPDGKQFVIHTYDDPQTIAVVNADGTGREDVLMHWGSPRWAPNGEAIFTLLQGGFGLFLLEQGEEIPIGQGWGPNYGYSVSPDSRCVCFGINEGLAVGVVDWPNKKMQVRVLLDNGHCGHTSWSPDSKRVAFAWEKEAGKPMQIYTLDVEGKDPPVRVKNQPEDRSNMDVDWSPDGKWLVFASQVFTE